MKKTIRKIKIWKISASGDREERIDEVLEENPLVLEVDGHEEAAVILSPGDEAYWALGHLRCRRMILSMKDVDGVSVEPGRIRVTRRVARQGIPLRSRIVHTAPSRLIDGSDVDETETGPLYARWSVSFREVRTAVKDLASAPLFRRTGSVHVAILADLEGKTLFRAEDVGRHNAVDKAVGWALHHGANLGECFMAVSGRLPADMVYKAICAGIPLLASVSAATASGVDTAEKGGITLIGFAREGRMNVYTHPERILGALAE